MNRDSVSRAAVACDRADVRRSWPGGRWGKGGLLALCLAIVGVASMIFASTILPSPGMGEVANAAGCDGALLSPTGNLTLLAAAHVSGTNYRGTLGAEKATARGTLIAGRHHAYIAKGRG